MPAHIFYSLSNSWGLIFKKKSKPMIHFSDLLIELKKGAVQGHMPTSHSSFSITTVHNTQNLVLGTIAANGVL